MRAYAYANDACVCVRKWLLFVIVDKAVARQGSTSLINCKQVNNLSSVFYC